MNTTKHYVDVDSFKSELGHYHRLAQIEIDNEVKPIHAFLNLFSSDSYNISRFESEDFEEKLIQILAQNRFDFVQLESLYLAPYIEVIRQHSEARIVLRAHNVEHEIWQRMTGNEENALKRWYLEYSARKLRRYEIEQLHLVDILIPISRLDEEKFRRLGYEGPMQVLPIGLDLESLGFRPLSKDEPLSISFIGSLDWMPNLEALNWFLDQIWPHLTLLFPTLELHVAGRNCPEWLMSIEMRNVIVHGEVASSIDFLQSHPISVVPLLSGSGMRAKILEAMALGRVVLTSGIGLEGIDAKDGEHLLVANTPQQFINQVKFCYQNKGVLPEIGENARHFIETHFDHLMLTRNYLEFLSSHAVQT